MEIKLQRELLNLTLYPFSSTANVGTVLDNKLIITRRSNPVKYLSFITLYYFDIA